MKRELIPAILAVIAFGIGAMISPFFLDASYLFDATTLYIEIGLLAMGMLMVIMCGEIDLSVASMVALVAVVGAMLLEAGFSIVLAAPVMIGLGILLGLVNGALVAYAGLPSFMVTIGTLALYRGIAKALLGGRSVPVAPELTSIDALHMPGTFIPVSLVILLLIAALVHGLLTRTVMGRWIASVGSSPKVSLYSGVPVARVRMFVFAAAGFFSSLAAMHIDSRLSVAEMKLAEGKEVDVITAVVLGGAVITGGRGSVGGTLLALLLIAILRTGLGLANVTEDYQLAIIGSLLVGTVLLGNLAERYAVAKSR